MTNGAKPVIAVGTPVGVPAQVGMYGKPVVAFVASDAVPTDTFPTAEIVMFAFVDCVAPAFAFTMNTIGNGDPPVPPMTDDAISVLLLSIEYNVNCAPLVPRAVVLPRATDELVPVPFGIAVMLVAPFDVEVWKIVLFRTVPFVKSPVIREPEPVEAMLPLDDKLVPETAPVDATDDGVIAPNVNVIAGVVVDVATEPETPFAVVTETEVTVPLVAGAAQDGTPEAFEVRT